MIVGLALGVQWAQESSRWQAAIHPALFAYILVGAVCLYIAMRATGE